MHIKPSWRTTWPILPGLCALLGTELTNPAQAQTILSNQTYTIESLSGASFEMYGQSELQITGSTTPLSGSTINLCSEDAWVFLPAVVPSTAQNYVSQFKINGAAAVLDSNLMLVQYAQGSVFIPYPSDFQPMEVFVGPNFQGESQSLSPYTAYSLVLSGKVSSFTLKRGYMATLAKNSDGTGTAINYVASDGDLHISALPEDLNNAVRFIRIYPWRWVAKKGSCDIAASAVDAQWFYNWNVTSQAAARNYEYVAIKQQRWWPGLPNLSSCEYLGVNHVSGYNEPNNSVEDAYTSLNSGDVATAVSAWSELEGTGLRVGAPAVTDGGYSWIVDFIDQAEAAGRRVDYIPIHYYRASSNDPSAAASALRSFLKSVYDVAHKPIWLTEFNNGANWTTATDPTYQQNSDCIEAMVNMMDETPWVERYSVYSAVEQVRQVYYDAGGYTPMGEMYRDHESPNGYQQIIPGEGMNPSATYRFENNLDDDSGAGNAAMSKNYPDFVTGHNGGTALQFDGEDDHVILPDSLSDGTDFTFAAWVYWDGGSAWQRIFDFGILDSNYYMFLTPTTGSALRFSMTTSGWSGEQRLTSTSALPQNTWTHVAITISGDTGRMYVNGTQVAVNTSMTINPADLGAIQHYLGRSMFPSDPYFAGQLDDVIFLDTALTATQIAALQTTQPPVASTNLIDGGSLMADEDTLNTSVAGTVTDPDEGEITYRKLYGADWVSVASDGTISGTPGLRDGGTEYVTVQASDPAGASTYLTVKVEVEVPPYDFSTGPVAYWDFNDTSLGAADGAAVPDSDGMGVWRTAAVDKSGNGNDLTTWDHAWAGFNWSTDSQQGDFSLVAAGTYPAAYTWSSESEPAGYDVESVPLNNFTVEVIATTSGSGHRTAVGRDARYVATGSPDLSAFYLKINPDDHPEVTFVDESGTTVTLTATDVTVANDDATWYCWVVVKDGDTVSLYVDNELETTTTVSGLGALATGTTSVSGNYHAGGWSVGRGLYAGGHTDRFYGHIDAVAISGVALAPGSFVTETFGKSAFELYALSYGIPDATFTADADNDGSANGLEFFLGSDPTSAQTPSNTLWWADSHLSATYPFNPSATDLTGRVEWTTDLVNGLWSDSGITYFTNSLLGEIDANLGLTTTNQLFIRLKVEQ